MIEVYCDGARKKTGLGGWGCIIRTPDQCFYKGGYLESVTNNVAELESILNAIEALFNIGETLERRQIIVYSDSNYCVSGINEWMHRWERMGWSRHPVKDAPVANLEYWKKLLELKKQLNIKCKWVKGHSGHPENDFCDTIANFCWKHKCRTSGVIPIDSNLETFTLYHSMIADN